MNTLRTLSRKTILGLVTLSIVLIAVPVTVLQLQNQQNIRQRASEISALWVTAQAATTICPPEKEGAVIVVSFSNAESPTSTNAMNVKATDSQTGKSVNIINVIGKTTKTAEIKTGKATLNAGKVTFTLTWTDGHSGVDSRTANYNAVSNCLAPTPTPQPNPSATPTPAPNEPTPTICPTLGPVKNVHIDCPNCPKQ